MARLPYALKVLLENLLRNGEDEGVEAVAKWAAKDEPSQEIAYRPARVLMQDFTGVPAIVDLAAMRDAMEELGGDAGKINPLVPVELVIDHSIQVDVFAERLAFQRNAELEFERNRERYAFLRWGQTAFDNFKVVPPNTGICHQVNLEYLARVVESRDGQAFPDTLVGHRLAHHDGERPRRARLGRGRDRGRGRDARPAGVDARAAGGGLQAHGRAARGLDRHRPRAHGHADAARARRGGEVRGVPRSRPAEPAAGGPRDDREHVARDGRDLRDLPGGRRDAPLPRVLRAPARAGRAGRGLLPRAGPLPRRGLRGGHLLGRARARPRRRGALARRPEAPAGPRGALERRGRLPLRARGVHGR